MKKYKFLFILVLLLGAIFLGSCGEGKENEKIDDEPTKEVQKNNNIRDISDKASYVLVEGDKFNPFYNIDERFNFISSNEKVLKVDKNGNIKAIGEGKAKVEVRVSNEYYATASFNVKAAPKVNPNFDEKIYNEILTKDVDAKEATVTIQNVVNGVRSTSITKLRLSPFYFETNVNGKVNYIKESNTFKDKYFLYDVNDKRIDKTYIKNFKIKDYEIEDTLDITKNIDYSKIELNKINENKYNIKAKLSVFTSFASEYFGELEELYGNITNNAVLDMNISFENNKTTVDVNVPMHFVYQNIIFDMPFNLTMETDFNKIVEFDSSNYEISSPESIEDVDSIEELNEFYVEGTKYAYTYLKKGRYVFEAVDDVRDSEDLKIKVYDSTLNEIQCNEIPYVDYLGNIINISNDGYYYLQISISFSYKTKCKMITLDKPLPEAKVLQSTSGVIHNKYDYDLYTYNSTNENEILKLKNLSNNTLYLYVKSLTTSDWYGFMEVAPNKEIYMNPEENSKLYVISAINNQYASNSYNYEYEYNFSIESVVNEYGNDSNTILLSQDEYSDYFMIGYKLPKRKAILKAEKPGIYGLKAMNTNGVESRFSLAIIGATSNGWECELEAGEYEVIVTTNDHLFDIVKLKYYFIDTADKDEKIELKESRNPLSYESAQYNSTQKVRYMFDLEKDCYLIFNSKDVAIYNLNDELLSPLSLSYNIGYSYFKFKAGSYYLINRANYYSSIYISIAITEPTLYIDLDNPTELTSDTTYTLEDSDWYSPFFGKFVALGSKIEISDTNCLYELYDENLKVVTKVENEDYTYGYNLVEGKTYYVLFKAQDTSKKATFRFRCSSISF